MDVAGRQHPSYATRVVCLSCQKGDVRCETMAPAHRYIEFSVVRKLATTCHDHDWPKLTGHMQVFHGQYVPLPA